MKFKNKEALDNHIAEEAKKQAAELIEAEKTKESEEVKKKEAEEKTAPPTVEVGPDRLSLDPMGGYRGLSEFTRDVYLLEKKQATPKLDAWLKAAGTGMLEGTDEYGGSLIPDGFVPNILQIEEEESNFSTLCQSVPMTGLTTLIPAIDDTDHSSTFGGIRFYKVEEEGDLTESRTTLGKVRLTLDKHAGLFYVTDEMLQDAPQIDSIMTGRFGMALAWYKDGYILKGTGQSEPVGVLDDGNNALIEVARTTTSHVEGEDFFNMWARMHTPLKPNSVWIVNSNVIPDMQGMMLGTNFPLYMPPGGLTPTPYGTIFGRPVIESEHATTLGTVGDVSLMAFSEYLFAEKSMGAAAATTSIHVKFLNMQTAFRFAVRFDGKPWWFAARTPKNGDTKSPYITLAT